MLTIVDLNEHCRLSIWLALLIAEPLLSYREGRLLHPENLSDKLVEIALSGRTIIMR